MEELIPIEIIESKIYLIRGQKVMLDRDLAELYEVETRVLNQAVRRNLDRFPGDFVFPLSRQEITRISQLVISSDFPKKASLKFSKSVFVFTEQGVAMLSSVLSSARAIQVNIAIMRAFVKIREMLSANRKLAQELKQLEEKIEKHDGEIKVIFDAIRQLMIPPETKKKGAIGFRGRRCVTNRRRYGEVRGTALEKHIVLDAPAKGARTPKASNVRNLKSI